jgi:transposase
MGFIRGEARCQQTLFPVALEDAIPADHMCRVIDAFVDRLDFRSLGFQRADSAETGRPGYDPRDLLKLYLYGYLQQVRSSRRLEAECRRNVELMWLLSRLEPDHKSIAEFRRLHRGAVTEAGAELVRFARSVGLVRGEWVAIDGSKFQAVSGTDGVREREALRRYLNEVERADAADEVIVDPAAVVEALKKLQAHPEPEAGFMRIGEGFAPAYNVQTAVDAEHALIVTQTVVTAANDNTSLLAMATSAKQAVGSPETLKVVADKGYSNGEQAHRCEQQGILAHVPAQRGVNNQADGTLLDRSQFVYDETSDTFRCPNGATLPRHHRDTSKPSVLYAASPKDCGSCPLKSQCTTGARRTVRRHLYDDALKRMQQRATPEAMRLRRSTVEHPFATLKYRIFGHPRLLLRGLRGAQTEISLATAAYNLKRMINVLGCQKLTYALAS